MIELDLKTIRDSERFALLLARNIQPNMVFSFDGNLGAGKTTIIRSILRNMGVTGSIKSPTFTIVEPYQINQLKIYHFDLYRIEDATSWYDLGFDDYFTDNYLCFIEWASMAIQSIPKIDITIDISISNNYHRRIKVFAITKFGEKWVQNLTKIVENF